MLSRVSCSRCRLSPAWTDDPDGLLQSICNRPFRCLAQLRDEQLCDVTPRYMEKRHLALWSTGAVPSQREVVAVQAAAPRRRSLFSTLGVLVVSCIAAALISHDLASAYESGAILSIAIELVLPPLASLLVYHSSSKSPVAVALSVSIAALAIGIFGIDRVSASALDGFLLVTSSVAIPIALDLSLADMGRALRYDNLDWRIASLGFVVALPVLFLLAFPSTLRTAQQSDAGLIRRLVRRTKTEGSSLVIERLDPQVAADARRRVAVRADGRTYDLSDAAVQTTVEERTIAKRVERRGVTRSHKVNRAQEERVTLVLDLAGQRIPEQIEFDGLRGPTTIYSEKVALAK
jgi:hypothetical protein